jgi:hypothetical protein
VPRKGIRLFASKCHTCNRVDTKNKNVRVPRQIMVAEVRQRYTLDLIDMLVWQQASTGDGRHHRYVAHMIDYSSKRRWAEPIKDKTMGAVQRVVRSVFQNFGQPAVLHTDNGTEFANKVVEQECRDWGVYMIHGRPYHPQSQGVVERINSVLKKAMRKYQQCHPQLTDWTLVLSHVLPWLNQQVHSVTGQVPTKHFDDHNYSNRAVQPLDARARVVITMAEVAAIPSLNWVAPCAVMDYNWVEPDEPDDVKNGSQSSGREEAVHEDVDMVGAEESSDAVEMSTESFTYSQMVMDPVVDMSAAQLFNSQSVPHCGEESEEGDVDEEDVMPTATGTQTMTQNLPSSSQSPTLLSSSQTSTPSVITLRPRPPPSPVESSKELRPSSRFSILSTGAVGTFEGPEWDDQLIPPIRSWMRRRGCLANGDCGPASAYFVQHGTDATPQQAAQMRTDVLNWSLTSTGQAYYKRHGVGEIDQSPEELSIVQAEWAQPYVWVTPEFHTCFGGMMGDCTNVFLICRSLNDFDDTVHCGIRLVTNGGELIQTNDTNCVCIYFQYTVPYTVGHFEPVQDIHGRHQWKVEDDIVQRCLYRCMVKTRMSRSVNDMRKKQMTAAINRINRTNESFKVGDLAWLLVPQEVVNWVTNQLSSKKEKLRAADGKLLVKIGRVLVQEATEDVPLSTLHYVLWTE